MKNLILIVLVALCLVGCIGRGQDLELEYANTLVVNKQKSVKEAEDIEAKLADIIHKSEGNVIVKTTEFFGKSCYIRKKDSYYCWDYEYFDSLPYFIGTDRMMYITHKQWEQLPNAKQKKFKKW